MTVADSGCWEWQRARFKSGYGAIRVDRKATTTHRVAYRLWVGEIPAGMFVLHRCDNCRCVNPAHLFLGTHHDNMKDATAKGRAGMSGKLHSARTKEIIRERHSGKPPAWFEDQTTKASAYRKVWDTRRERYGRSGGNGKKACP